MTCSTPMMTGLLLILLLVRTPLLAGPIDSTDAPHHESMRAVHVVEHEVDHAWEFYHRAALGGTVASPQLQAEIEEHLHEARTLIIQAQEAAERGDTRQVDDLITQVRSRTTQAIEGTKEPKR